MSFGFGVGDFIAVLKLAGQVRQRWNDAPGEFAVARNEIRSLENLLRDIGDFPDTVFTTAQKSTLDDIVVQCKDVLKAANKLVDDYSTPSSNNLRKVWKRLKADADDVRHVRDQLVSLVTQLNAVQNNVQIELDRKHLHNFQDYQVDHANEKQLKIADWFSDGAFAQQQDAQINLRQPGTAAWFLQHEAFRTWRDGLNQTLFCPGIAGAGKSVIFATVVADLRTYFENDPKTIVTFFYCNYKRQMEQTLPLVLSAFVRQLFQEQVAIPQFVLEAYEKHVKRASNPSIDELYTLIEMLVALYSKVFILIDALDECNNDNDYFTRDKLISYFSHIQKKANLNVNIMTTSRPGVITEFRDCPKIEIRAQAEDITRYLDANVGHSVQCIKHRHDLQRVVRDEIAGIADGMFLLARLHLESLQDQTKPRDVLRALKRLPRGSQSEALNQAYDDLIDRIEKQRDGFRALARKTLTWMTYAKRELTMDELREALAIEPGMTQIDHELDLDNKDTITSVCAGLVVVESESGVVKLAHYTAQVYLEGIVTQWLSQGKDDIAYSCLTYLCMPVLYADGIQWQMNLWPMMQRYKLLRYVGQHWGVHLRELDNIPAALKSAVSDDIFQCLTAQLALGNEEGRSTLYDCYTRDIPPLHLFTYFDYQSGLRFLIDEGHDINSLDSDHRSALHYAALYGKEAAASFLLTQKGIDASLHLLDTHDDTPLSLAVYMRYPKIVALLLDRPDIGLSVNLEIESGETPLSCAVLTGCSDTVAQLLARTDIGPSLDFRNDRGETLLFVAAKCGHTDVFAQLLARQELDWSLNLEDCADSTPLCTASRLGHTQIVSMLLSREDIGPSVNLRDVGGNPLHHAIDNGHDEIVTLLLSRHDIGPSINTFKFSCSPLDLAIRNNRIEIVTQLLARQDVSPSVSRRGNGGKTPLSLAAFEGYGEIVAQLLSREDIVPSLNVPTYFGSTPLSLAAMAGFTEIVTRLLDRKEIGPSVISKAQDGKSPLSRARAGEYDESISQQIIRWHKEHGQDN